MNIGPQSEEAGAASLADDGPPAPQEIRAYLTRLLGAPTFPASARRGRLLTYIVEQTLAGRAERLKAYDLALSVLGRDQSFDPASDPIVRIEVGRLRRDLEHWYLTDGRADLIRITIPKGRYVPAFETVEPATATPPSPRHWRSGWRTVTGVGVGALLAAVAWYWSPWPANRSAQLAGPAVIVQPLETMNGGDETRLLASGLTAGLISDLMPFDGIQVFAGVASLEGLPALPAAAVDVPVFVIAGEVARGASRIRVIARLMDGRTREVLWSQVYERQLSTAGIFDVGQELTAAIIGRLAPTYGIIDRHAARQLRQDRPETLFAYDCVQRAFAYRQAFDMNLYPGVRSCLEAAVRRDPDYGAAWAMLAFAHLDAARYGLVEPTLREAEMQAGLDAAQRAVDLAPGSVVALQSLAALRYGNGDFDESERLQRRAIALNPNNPEGLAQLGWRLVVRGRPEEGRVLLEDAIARSTLVPSWYRENLALALWLGGEHERARDEAELGKSECCGDAYALLAITEATLGNAAAARTALAEALRQAPVLATDPNSLWANFHVAADVAERLNAGLVAAGLQLPPPEPSDAGSAPGSSG